MTSEGSNTDIGQIMYPDLANDRPEREWHLTRQVSSSNIYKRKKRIYSFFFDPSNAMTSKLPVAKELSFSNIPCIDPPTHCVALEEF